MVGATLTAEGGHGSMSASPDFQPHNNSAIPDYSHVARPPFLHHGVYRLEIISTYGARLIPD